MQLVSRELNRISKVQECDARMMNRKSNAGNKKVKSKKQKV